MPSFTSSLCLPACKRPRRHPYHQKCYSNDVGITITTMYTPLCIYECTNSRGENFRKLITTLAPSLPASRRNRSLSSYQNQTHNPDTPLKPALLCNHITTIVLNCGQKTYKSKGLSTLYPRIYAGNVKESTDHRHGASAGDINNIKGE